jgi:carbon monoxide dehydrogenase subunit G
VNLEQSFTVKAPLQSVWEALIDVERVAPCLPGAEITEASDDGTYRGAFTVKLGPTTAAYRGELKMEAVDESSHTVTMRANGQDKRGQGSAKATIVSVMRTEGEATVVDVQTDFTITGRLARFGRGGMIKDVSNRLLRDFSSCLTQTIEAEGAAGVAPPAGARAAAGASGSVTPAEPGPSGAPVPAGTATAAATAGPAANPGPSGSPTEASAPASAGPAAAAAPAPGPPRERPAPAKSVSGISLLLSVLRERIGRLFGRG